MTDPIHDLLTDEGQRWRASLSPDPELTAMLAGPPPAPRRRLLPAMLAAALIVAVAVAVSIFAGRGGHRPSVVAAPPATCQDRFTAAPAHFTDTGRGQQVALRLTYNGTGSCVIDGSGPHVDLLDAAGKSLGHAVDASLVYRSNPTVEPGDVVTFTLTLDGICPAVDQPVTALRLHMDGDLHTGSAGVEVPVPGARPSSCPPRAQPGVIMGFGFPQVHKAPSAGRLTPRERLYALRVAHRQADRLAGGAPGQGTGWPRNISMVTATVRSGVVTDPNVGHATCTSGHLVAVQLLGDFPSIITGGIPQLPGSRPAANSGVHEVDISLDAKDGTPCLLGVRTGSSSPTAGATVLYRR